MDKLIFIFPFFLGLLYWPIVIWFAYSRRNNFANWSASHLALFQLPLTFGLILGVLGFPSMLWIILCPTSILVIVPFFAKWINLLGVLFVSSMIIGLVTWFVIRKTVVRWKYFALPLAVIASIAGFFVTGEIETKKLQEIRIAAFGFECVKRKSFWHSAHIAGEEFQFSLHTSGKKAGRYYGWSFRDNDFYENPATALANVGAGC